MKCLILHQTRGRLRVHLACRAMSLREADILEYYLRAVPGVQSVKVYDRTQDAVITYTGSRDGVVIVDSGLSDDGVKVESSVPIRASEPTTLLSQ